MKKNRAVFMDRDGTINEEVGYLDRLERIVLFPAAFEAIRTINESGLKAVVITNQSGVARGFFDEDFVKAVHEKINEMLREKGAFIDKFYYCPHHPGEGHETYRVSCECRKPKPGMLLRAAEEMDIDLSGSYMIGDMPKDVEAGIRAGAKGILVKTGYKIDPAHSRKADYIAEDIADAVEWIMKDLKR